MDNLNLESLKKLSFEKALEELEAIVKEMECGNLPLEKMIEAYEKGNLLAKICSSKLQSVEKKIEVLKNSADNNVTWENFEDDIMNNADVAKSPSSQNSEDMLF